MTSNASVAKSTSEPDIARETEDKGQPEKVPDTNGDLGITTNRDFESRMFDRTTYRAQGSSLGNKILIAVPIVHIVVSLLFIIGSYFYARDTSGTSFMEQGNNVAFISELGNNQPQSSLFTLGIVLTSFSSLCIIATRFFQVKHFFVKYDGKLNITGLIVGMVFVFGKIVSGCFQEASQREVHFTGAGFYVIFASIYAGIQTFITYKNRTLYSRWETAVLALRAFCSLGMVIGTIIFLVFLHPDLRKYNRSGKSVSQGAEWFLVVCKMLFMLTFVSDFWYLHPRWLLIKPHNETLSDLVLSNLNVETNSAVEQKVENSAGKGPTLPPIQE